MLYHMPFPTADVLTKTNMNFTVPNSNNSGIFFYLRNFMIEQLILNSYEHKL